MLAERLKGLEEHDLSLLRGWLDRETKAIADRAAANRKNRAENRKRNEKPDQLPSAFLFGHGASKPATPWQAMGAIDLATEKPWINAPVADMETIIAGKGYYVSSIAMSMMKRKFGG